MSWRGSGAVTMAVTEPIRRLPWRCLYLVYHPSNDYTNFYLEVTIIPNMPGSVSA